MATLEEAQTLCQTLPNDDLTRLRTWITITEMPRREAQPQIEQAEAELVTQLQAQHPELAPDYATDVAVVDTLEELFAKLPAWKQPASKATAYPPNSLVKHQEKAYRARRLTDKEPGTPFDGWEDVTADFLRPEPIADGNDPEVGTDAPGLITEPEPEPEPVTPAPQVQEWYAGAKIEAGIPWRHDGQVHIAKINHTASATNAPGKSTRHWQPLPE